MNKRYFAFDLFKFVALSCIMIYHTLDYWSLESSRNFIQTSSSFIETVWNLGGIFCYFPCIGLTFISGISFYLMIKNRLIENKIAFNKSNLIFIAKRSSFLFAMAYLMLLFSSYKSDLFHWDILQFIGLVSFVSFLFLKFVPVAKFYYLSIGVFIIYLATRGYALSYDDQLDNISSLFVRLTVGSSSGKSYYAFFPWAMYFFLGISTGFSFVNNKVKLLKSIKVGLIPLSIFYLLTFNYWTLDYSNVWGSHFYLPSFLECFGILFTMLSFLIICDYCDAKIKNESLKNVINIFSHNIIYVFVSHSILVFSLVEFVRQKTDSDLIFVILVIVQYLISFSVAYLANFIKSRKKNVDI